MLLIIMQFVCLYVSIWQQSEWIESENGRALFSVWLNSAWPFDLSSRWAIIRPICRQIDCVSTEDIGFVLSPSRSSQSSHRSSTKRLLSALALASILMFGLPNCSIANHCDWLLAIQVTCFLFLPIHAAAAAAEPPATTNNNSKHLLLLLLPLLRLRLRCLRLQFGKK